MSYKENLHVSVKQSGLRTSKERDDLEIFFNDITSSKLYNSKMITILK